MNMFACSLQSVTTDNLSASIPYLDYKIGPHRRNLNVTVTGGFGRSGVKMKRCTCENILCNSLLSVEIFRN